MTFSKFKVGNNSYDIEPGDGTITESKLSDELSAIIDKTAKIESFYNDNTIGYIQFSNGLLIQWGTTDTSDENITIPLAYTSSYVPLAVRKDDHDYNTTACSTWVVDMQTFKFPTQHAKAYWITIGI